MALGISQNQRDAELLARFSKGDRAAALALTSRLAPVVFAQAFRMLGDRAEAEDVTQESLLRLWKAAPGWDATRAKITTWLYRVTSNLCIDCLRKSNRNSGDEVPEVADETPGIDLKLQATARAQALQHALQTLPDRQRQAMILRHIEDLSNPEISDIMEISVEAVESLVSRGKRALASTLAPQKKALGLEDD
ncbi:MAG: sigma-70 family RNA polymerase sigma factor [Rhodobacterales bacterium]|uniref:sigma-70 family RNA polymerase sigma factor n=1 Tax=uncultured Planktomarina sp. TaxID=1538529 RepID=UPI00230AC4C8|nr:sigma-70 family RNA polymerase sigma factor [Planktomarina sp.]